MDSPVFPFEKLPELESDRAILIPLKEADFEDLFNVAKDPLIWEQHPNNNRWKEDVFRNFFQGALESKGAYKIIHKPSGETIGSTRMYDYSENENRICIGYTFYAREYWGSGINHEVKKRMLHFLFSFVDSVEFHIGAKNIRSQTSIMRLGALKSGEKQVTYHAESPSLNFIYNINKSAW